MVARFVREERKAKKTWSTNGGAKRQKHFHHTRSSQASKKKELEKRTGLDRLEKAIRQLLEKYNNHRQGDVPRNLNFRNIQGQKRLSFLKGIRNSITRTKDMGQTSTMMGLPHFKPYYDMSVMPTSRYRYNHQNYTQRSDSSPNYNFKPRN